MEFGKLREPLRPEGSPLLGIAWCEQYADQNMFTQLKQRLNERNVRSSEGVLGVSSAK